MIQLKLLANSQQQIGLPKDSEIFRQLCFQNFDLYEWMIKIIRNPQSAIRNPQSKLRLMLDGELDQGVAAAQVEFGGDVVAVMFDGADADAH